MVVRASLDTDVREGDDCPTCKANTVVLCECGQGDPAEHLICLGCGEDPPDCDCEGHVDV